ncbi:hypothetical protein J9303_10355 [Bacillaceae bacterium Marseille-Q3522]|nr:hypothetical protein [Bacillaceae bacterium Marseille-Q3522]
MNMEELLRNLWNELRPLLEKKLLIFLSGGSVNTDILLKILKEQKNARYMFVLTESREKMTDIKSLRQISGQLVNTMEDLENSLREAELILIPVMTRNTLAKAALGIADNLVTTGIARAIMLQKEVIAVRDSFNPQHEWNRVNGLSNNNAYNQMLAQYERQLQFFGVKFVDLVEFQSTLKEKLTPPAMTKAADATSAGNSPLTEAATESAIITMAEINRFGSQEIIPLKAGTIITPLAKEYLDQHEIKIKWLPKGNIQQ